MVTTGGSSGEGMSASCTKCVKALQELISGLQQQHQKEGRHCHHQHPHRQHHPSRGGADEPAPLTLIKAIAETSVQQQQQQQQQLLPASLSTTTRNRSDQQQELKVEQVEDGVRLTIPVEATMPNLLRRWTKIVPAFQQAHGGGDDDTIDNREKQTGNMLLQQRLSHNALATSVVPSTLSAIARGKTTTTTTTPSSPAPPPLMIELKCRKCASTGPEGGARAFLMGPQPLSVILCHNRIESQAEEINEILTHELTHLYDVQTLQLDLQECESLAYSEVRAAKSAECRNWSTSFQPYCVKSKAMNATHNLYPREARSCVNKVFETAFRDHRPFQTEDAKSSSSSSSTSSAGAGFRSSTSNR